MDAPQRHDGLDLMLIAHMHTESIGQTRITFQLNTTSNLPLGLSASPFPFHSLLIQLLLHLCYRQLSQQSHKYLPNSQHHQSANSPPVQAKKNNVHRHYHHHPLRAERRRCQTKKKKILHQYNKPPPNNHQHPLYKDPHTSPNKHKTSAHQKTKTKTKQSPLMKIHPSSLMMEYSGATTLIIGVTLWPHS